MDCSSSGGLLTTSQQVGSPSVDEAYNIDTDRCAVSHDLLA